MLRYKLDIEVWLVFKMSFAIFTALVRSSVGEIDKHSSL